jgi:hypothetical protein
VRRRLQYECELITLILLVLISGISYGILEAIYIPTDIMQAKVIPWTGGHVAYYHLCLFAQMFVAAFSITFMADWIAIHRRKYTLLMSIAGFFLALWVEDVTWFITRWQPIHRTEWTVWPAGWAIPLGFTWVPVWYPVILILSVFAFILASKFATLGYKRHLTDSLESGRVEYGSSPTPGLTGQQTKETE